MFTRLLEKPNSSTFLFGPRGTGKSTWIAEHFHESTLYDLLSTTESLRLSRDPGLLFREVESQPAGSWVVIDEVQKVPALLDEVHRLIETRDLRFILSGSSARKLRRGGTNLLAGRALVANLYPLVWAEVGAGRQVDDALCYGSLPLAVTGADPVPYLRAYAETYLDQEIRAEALTRDVGAFSRFLEVAARQNGQVTNVSSIARDAAVNRQTVQTYFEILVDTLVGFWVRPWKLKSATKQVASPKFYLFDSGLARALSQRLPYPPTDEESGALLETLIFNEVRAYLDYRGLHYPLHYWRTYDGAEVDLFCETRRGYVAVEIKATQRWERRHLRGLNRLRDSLGDGVTCYGVYRGERSMSWGPTRILPVQDFLVALWNGEILP
jgi:predicted AAA+ superfamily ATPase